MSTVVPLLVVIVFVVVDIFYLQHMISYRTYVIKKEALESNHTFASMDIHFMKMSVLQVRGRSCNIHVFLTNCVSVYC